MRWPENTYLKDVAAWLPPAVDVTDAAARGLVDADRVKALGYQSICVDESTAPPDMAVHAATAVAERAELGRRDAGLLLHCSTWFQGLDIWPVASYVGARIAPSAPALDLQQRCNGALGALDLAAAFVHAGDTPRQAVITTADRFAPPAVDRWNMHEFNIYADGATAAVVSGDRGFARILATATVADNQLEAMARGDEPFRTASPAAAEPIDLVRRSTDFDDRSDTTRNATRVMRVMTKAAMLALRDAERDLKDLRRVVQAATGRLRGGFHFHSMLGLEESVTTWDFGSRTGHVGTGDWFAGLEHLLGTGEIGPGDTVLLFGGGAGYTCTAAVLEILERPAWATS